MAQLATGGGITFDQFFAAIAAQESGGDYGAVNPRTGASGKYQILPSNIGPWSQQYLGRRISVATFRNSPALQDQLARAVLKDYFGRYGARGAAAAWYSGDPGKANDYQVFRKGEPSIGQYVDEVLGRVGSGGGTTTPGSPGTPANGLSTQPVAGDLLTAPQAPLGQPDGMAALAAPTFDTLGTNTAQVQAASALNPALGMSYKPRGGTGSDPVRDRLIAKAMGYIGTPYVWGGASPSGFDCSGLLKFVYGDVLPDMPRISADQARYGRRVSLDQLRPGDWVAMDNSSRNNGADHIAIYIGNGQIIEAPHPGASVRVRNIGKNEGFYGVALDI